MNEILKSISNIENKIFLLQSKIKDKQNSIKEIRWNVKDIKKEYRSFLNDYVKEQIKSFSREDKKIFNEKKKNITNNFKKLREELRNNGKLKYEKKISPTTENLKEVENDIKKENIDRKTINPKFANIKWNDWIKYEKKKVPETENLKEIENDNGKIERKNIGNSKVAKIDKNNSSKDEMLIDYVNQLKVWAWNNFFNVQNSTVLAGVSKILMLFKNCNNKELKIKIKKEINKIIEKIEKTFGKKQYENITDILYDIVL